MTTEHPDTPSADPTAPGTAPAGVAHPKTIKSYVKRAGRTTTGQAKAFEELGPRFLLPYTGQPLDAASAFGRSAPLILEIGFGMGEATAHIARVRPDDNFLCCEVREPGVGALLKRIGEQDIHNIRILQHDAVEVLEHMLPGQPLAGIHIFFPDPWHKKKHNKRRLIQTPFVAHYAGVALAHKLGLPAVATYHTLFEEYLYHYISFLPREWLRGCGWSSASRFP